MIISGFISSAPSLPSGKPAFNTAFNMPPGITLLHILPGLLFMILGPLQFVKRIRKNHLNFHRWSGRVFVLAAYFVGLSALIMPFIVLPIGGLTEAAGSVFFSIFFLTALTKAVQEILRKRVNLHREWMLRMFAIGLAISTVRPIMGLSFALFKLQPQDFLGTAFWIGFSLHAIAAEIWINCTRKPAAR
jgi:uncharacterized membrane protein